MSSNIFNSDDHIDFALLGKYIEGNTHLKKLDIAIDDIAVDCTSVNFFEALKRNSSIREVMIAYGYTTQGGVIHKILQGYQINSNLTCLSFPSVHNGWSC